MTRVAGDGGAGNGNLARARLDALVDQCAQLQRDGVAQVALVSSGAVVAGRGLLTGASSDDAVTDRQVCAALGQTELINFYRDSFARHKLLAAQVLATRQDFSTRRHYLNMRACLQALLKRNIVPIINENDVVSVTELMFTDNDELASLVAGMLGAERLILLSDVDGVFDNGPIHGQLIQAWSGDEVVPDRPASGTGFGRGGIGTKVSSAQRAAAMGTASWIANGLSPGILNRIASDENVGTRFPASQRPSEAKRWVAAAPTRKASIVINDGTVAALRDADRLTSLLPVGIVSLGGEFERGDVLRIESETAEPVAYGRAEYDSTTATELLGKRRQKPLVHYNYLHVIDHG